MRWWLMIKLWVVNDYDWMISGQFGDDDHFQMHLTFTHPQVQHLFWYSSNEFIIDNLKSLLFITTIRVNLIASSNQLHTFTFYLIVIVVFQFIKVNNLFNNSQGDLTITGHKPNTECPVEQNQLNNTENLLVKCWLLVNCHFWFLSIE